MVKLSILFTLFNRRHAKLLMQVGKTLTLTGITTVIFGIVFHLQGQSAIGPEASFMYSNPNRATYGIQIMIIGTSIMASGIIISKKS